MRIHYLVTVLDGFGAALPIVDVVSVMRELGHDVEVIAIAPKDGVTCELLEQARIPYRFVGERLHQHAIPWLRLVRLLRAEKPDLIWTSLIQATVYGQLAGRLLGIPVVSWQHNAFLKASNRRILRVTKGLTSRWVADSDATARFSQEEVGLSSKQIDVWPLFFADPNQPRSRPWGGEGTFKFGSLGRLHANKRYDVLIEAAYLIARRDPEAASNITIEVAGTGKEHAALEALAKTRGVRNVHFVGYRRDVIRFLAGLHGYVQPSRNEGLCIAAHEAMHAGLPVVVTPVGELASSVVPDVTGYHVPVDDAEALAEALLRVFYNREKSARMGAAARSYVAERFSRQNFFSSGSLSLERAQKLCS